MPELRLRGNGGATFDEFGGPPFDNVQWLVLSSKDASREHKNVHFVSSAEQAIDKAKALGYSKLLMIGGAKTNRSFMDAGVVQKLMLDIHPLMLGRGIRLFGGCDQLHKLGLISSKTYRAGFIRVEYEVRAVCTATTSTLING